MTSAITCIELFFFSGRYKYFCHWLHGLLFSCRLNVLLLQGTTNQLLSSMWPSSWSFRWVEQHDSYDLVFWWGDWESGYDRRFPDWEGGFKWVRTKQQFWVLIIPNKITSVLIIINFFFWNSADFIMKCWSSHTWIILCRWMFKLSEWAHFSTYDIGLRSGSSASHILVCSCTHSTPQR